MFKFFVSDDIVSLIFENDNMEIHCYPENPDRLYNDSYKADTCDGHFEFTFNDSSITFRVAKYGKGGEGGNIVIYVKMTSEIKKSLDDALNEWRLYLNERDNDSDSEYDSE
jgi:hypothetical protein